MRLIVINYKVVNRSMFNIQRRGEYEVQLAQLSGLQVRADRK